MNSTRQGKQLTLPKPRKQKYKPTKCSLCGRKELANGICTCSYESI